MRNFFLILLAGRGNQNNSLPRSIEGIQLAAIQKQFIEVDLEKLIDSCDYLPYETMKQTIDGFASRLGVSLEWKELEDGQFECIPCIA